MTGNSAVLIIAQAEAMHAKVRRGMQAMVEACHEQLAKAQTENAVLREVNAGYADELGATRAKLAKCREMHDALKAEVERLSAELADLRLQYRAHFGQRHQPKTCAATKEDAQ